jgi:hypothetical protein
MENTLEQFLIDNGVDFGAMELLGSGENGTAWRCGDLVIKQTKSKWEYDFAVVQTTGEWPHFAKVFATAMNDEYYFYVAEFLQKDGEIASLFQLVDAMLATQSVSACEAWKFDYERYCDNYRAKRSVAMARASGASAYPRISTSFKPLSNATERFYHEIVAISLEYRRIGASDMHEGNMGWDSVGRLKAFDIDLDNEDKEELEFASTGKIRMY